MREKTLNTFRREKYPDVLRKSYHAVFIRLPTSRSKFRKQESSSIVTFENPQKESAEEEEDIL